MTTAAEARDLDVIRAAQAPGGAILAAPDYPPYRYAWLRDGSFAAHACSVTGEIDAAARFHAWVAGVVLAERPRIERAVAAVRAGGMPARTDHLACRFAPDGGSVPGEWGSFQLDGPAIWLWALEGHLRRTAGSAPSRGDPGTETPVATTPVADAAAAAAIVTRYLAVLWPLPCHDAWEEHPEAVHTSTLGAILAGLRATDRLGVADATGQDAIAAIETRLRAAGRERGWLPKWAGSGAVDGSLLWLGPVLGVFEPDDPLWIRTLARIERDLLAAHGGVYRYQEDMFYGGGEWPLLTAALGLASLQRAGGDDRERAAACVDWIDARANAHGDLPEQASCHPLHPDMVEPWRERWGPIARPLTWSHAMTLLLRRAIGASQRR